MKSFDDYKGILPYASELFGIYQPLLGWKSRIIAKRYTRIRTAVYQELAARALIGARAPVQVHVTDPRMDVLATGAGALSFTVENLAPVDLARTLEPHVSSTIDSGVARLVLNEVGHQPPADWRAVITRPHVDELLLRVKDILSSPEELRQHPEIMDYVDAFRRSYGEAPIQALLQELFAKESKVAGYLLFLVQHTPSTLDELFFQAPRTAMLAAARLEDPLTNFGANNYDAILSPIAIIHLYREYFFEFDSFLGPPPVGHVWLSPGAPWN